MIISSVIRWVRVSLAELAMRQMTLRSVDLFQNPDHVEVRRETAMSLLDEALLGFVCVQVRNDDGLYVNVSAAVPDAAWPAVSTLLARLAVEGEALR